MASENLGKAEYLKLLQELESNLRINEIEEKRDNCEKNELENTAFELVTGFRSTSKLLWIPSERCFYKKMHIRKYIMVWHILAMTMNVELTNDNNF